MLLIYKCSNNNNKFLVPLTEIIIEIIVKNLILKIIVVLLFCIRIHFFLF